MPIPSYSVTPNVAPCFRHSDNAELHPELGKQSVGWIGQSSVDI